MLIGISAKPKNVLRRACPMDIVAAGQRDYHVRCKLRESILDRDAFVSGRRCWPGEGKDLVGDIGRLRLGVEQLLQKIADGFLLARCPGAESSRSAGEKDAIGICWVR